jgi:hypothetical protein
MNFEEKKIQINKQIHDLDSMITQYIDTQKEMLYTIDHTIDMHKNFMNFIETMEILETYRWCELKKDYSDIKKKFNKNKKIIPNITNMYGDLMFYYEPEAMEKNNMLVRNINITHNILSGKFSEMSSIHKQYQQRMKQFVKNSDYYKIEFQNDKIKSIVDMLYTLYGEIKQLNKEFNNIKIKKGIIKMKFTKNIENNSNL